MKVIKTILILLLFSYNANSLAAVAYDKTTVLVIPFQIALPIGIKIWFNECNGSINGLTSWNKGEDFVSVGIGHFSWYPQHSIRASYNSGFPDLLRYMQSKGINIPPWLQGKNALHCPWSNRTEFLQQQYSPQMIALRLFLQKTIPIQAEYMTVNLQKILPKLLESAPIEDRRLIYDKFYSLARTPSGIYALVDYLNFKGPGISNSLLNYKYGSGLLQVLKGMKYAPSSYTPLQAFVQSAKHALIRRVEHSSNQQYERWLAGWFKRLNTYLEGDLTT
ncbi:MAG: hypothetical protein LBL17_00295 [Coxiellaceae bacterium]|jgi:hypothetical protein|nr:hypothetical protein [Coxiellaceae bacterium]